MGPDHEDRIGTTIAGRYLIHQLLGAGAQGAVYEAEHLFLARRVALKLQPLDTHRPEQLARFLREAKTLARVRHPNVVEVIDAGLDGRELYLAQQLLLGESLADRLYRAGPRPSEELRVILAAVLSGLAAAHAAGVVHRDVKPDNIFLCDDGEVRLVDFGIALDLEQAPITRAGVLVGSAAYMAPEQTRAAAPDPRSDLWALGVTAFEALTGRLPWRSVSLHGLLTEVAAADAVELPQGVPPALRAAIAGALQPSVEDRWPSADAMRAALGGVEIADLSGSNETGVWRAADLFRR